MNQTMHEQSESHNGILQPPSAHAIMLARLVRLILIVTMIVGFQSDTNIFIYLVVASGVWVMGE